MGWACNGRHRLLHPFLSVSDRLGVGGEDRAAEKGEAGIKTCLWCGEPMEVEVDEGSEPHVAPEQPFGGRSEPQHVGEEGRSCSVHEEA